MSIMIYKYPGSEKIHGDFFDKKKIQPQDLQSYLKKGWFENTWDAKNNHHKKKKEETSKEDVSHLVEFAKQHNLHNKVELQKKAKELDISFNARTHERVLLERIMEKMQAA